MTYGHGAVGQDSRNASLDTLRGVAVLLVVMVHAALAWKQSWIPGMAGAAQAIGGFGVQLFFIVSGYTMMLTYGRDGGRESARARDFYVRRFFRIAPLFWLATIGYALAYGLKPRYAAPDGVLPSDIALTALFLQWTSPAAFNAVVPGGWSIAVEMQFYLIFPMLFLWQRANAARPWMFHGTLMVASMSLVLIGESEPLHGFLAQTRSSAAHPYLVDDFLYFWLPHQIFAFCLGMHLYRLSAAGGRPGADSLVLLLWALGLGEWGLAVAGLFAVSLLVLGSGLRNRPIEAIGVRSFSIYLVHFILYDILRRVLPGLPFEVGFVAIVAASALVASVSKRWIEDPSAAAGRRLVNWLRERSRPGAGGASTATAG